MIDEDFKRIRRKFQGKCFKWERKDKNFYPWIYYYRIKKITPSDWDSDRCHIIFDMICIRMHGGCSIHTDFGETCKYKDRSFYSTFGKKIAPSIYRRKLFECEQTKGCKVINGHSKS